MNFQDFQDLVQAAYDQAAIDFITEVSAHE